MTDCEGLLQYILQSSDTTKALLEAIKKLNPKNKVEIECIPCDSTKYAALYDRSDGQAKAII
jgi:hypothetical protein